MNIKLRIEGTEKEIQPILERWAQMGIPTNDICLTLKVKSISKFYPNRNTAEKFLNLPVNTGRIYVEIG